MKSILLLVLPISLAVSGCMQQLHEVNVEPYMTPVGTGLVPNRVSRLDLPETEDRRVASNSTWRDSAGDMFRDARAVRIGDVVTVKIQIKDKASLDNTLERSRDSKSDLNAGLDYGFDIGPWKANGSGSTTGSIGRKTTTDSKGAIERSEHINLLVAAVVSEVLPNGNLVISGTQEVRVNYEVRILNVAGVIRPRDISTDNEISYDKIAEARISYGGRGRVTEIQQPAWGQQVVDIVSPF